MIGKVFDIEEIDEDGNPGIRGWWRDEDGRCGSRSIALEPLRPDYSTSPLATGKAAGSVSGRQAAICASSHVAVNAANFRFRRHSRLSSRMIRRTRLWFTCQPRRRSSKVIRGRP